MYFMDFPRGDFFADINVFWNKMSQLFVKGVLNVKPAKDKTFSRFGFHVERNIFLHKIAF